MAATTARQLGDIHPLAIHRRNHRVLTLILPGKLEEARQILAADWRLNAPFSHPSPRAQRSVQKMQTLQSGLAIAGGWRSEGDKLELAILENSDATLPPRCNRIPCD